VENDDKMSDKGKMLFESANALVEMIFHDNGIKSEFTPADEELIKETLGRIDALANEVCMMQRDNNESIDLLNTTYNLIDLVRLRLIEARPIPQILERVVEKTRETAMVLQEYLTPQTAEPDRVKNAGDVNIKPAEQKEINAPLGMNTKIFLTFHNGTHEEKLTLIKELENMLLIYEYLDPLFNAYLDEKDADIKEKLRILIDEFLLIEKLEYVPHAVKNGADTAKILAFIPHLEISANSIEEKAANEEDDGVRKKLQEIAMLIRKDVPINKIHKAPSVPIKQDAVTQQQNAVVPQLPPTPTPAKKQSIPSPPPDDDDDDDDDDKNDVYFLDPKDVEIKEYNEINESVTIASGRKNAPVKPAEDTARTEKTTATTTAQSGKAKKMMPRVKEYIEMRFRGGREIEELEPAFRACANLRDVVLRTCFLTNRASDDAALQLTNAIIDEVLHGKWVASKDIIKIAVRERVYFVSPHSVTAHSHELNKALLDVDYALWAHRSRLRTYARRIGIAVAIALASAAMWYYPPHVDTQEVKNATVQTYVAGKGIAESAINAIEKRVRALRQMGKSATEKYEKVKRAIIQD